MHVKWCDQLIGDKGLVALGKSNHDAGEDDSWSFIESIAAIPTGELERVGRERSAQKGSRRLAGSERMRQWIYDIFLFLPLPTPLQHAPPISHPFSQSSLPSSSPSTVEVRSLERGGSAETKEGAERERSTLEAVGGRRGPRGRGRGYMRSSPRPLSHSPPACPTLSHSLPQSFLPGSSLSLLLR